MSTEIVPSNVLLPGHDVPLGRYTTVRRLLPHRERRMVGAWCFVDHFGPDDVRGRPGMQVPPHPHTGLQTVTWLVDGIIEHRDSLGSHQLIAPGQLNLMTSGHGIAHSEYTPPDHPDGMHGLQLWLALPDAARGGPAGFEHHADLPSYRDGGATVTVVIGRLGTHASPATVFSPLVGAEILFAGAGRITLPLTPGFEHGILVMSGDAAVDGTPLEPGSLLYLGDGRQSVTVDGGGTARVFLLGGEPFEEPLVMWWNFVGRSHEDIVRAREQWMAGERFGTVAGCEAAPLPAPELPTVRLKARDRHGRTR
ncbi:pirin family protein [Actinoplanes missouriensis]|uniref:pirin family protein n=1 Tax=Actinoplanes missouriensis TaxID=1866 RepID=UPI0033F65A9A